MSLGKYDVAVIGGGIIGVATGMHLAQEHPRTKVVVLEKEHELARHQTGHNSGVMHAGIYYSPGSNKANLCASGGRMLRRFCDERGVPYEMCGKVIVATDESEVPGLDDLYRRGTANGAEGLEIIDQRRLRELEPHAAGIRAVHSPNTGIVDFARVTNAFATEMREAGGDLLMDTAVLRVVPRDSKLYLETSRGELAVKHVVNCAGLHADVLARSMGADLGLRIIPFRGEYFTIRPDRADLVRGLIYPVPDPKLPFLGVHFTRRISGGIEAGPNAVLAFAREGYSKTALNVSEFLGTVAYSGFWRMALVHWRTAVRENYRSLIKRSFHRSLQKLVPEVRLEDLSDPGAGVRAQAVDRKGRLLQDFSIVQTPNAIHVLNAPSPAATASLAISRHIGDLARQSFGLPAGR